MEPQIFKAPPDNPLLEKLIKESNPNLVVDIGSGSADYLVNSARVNPEKTYVAIDAEYKPGLNLQKEKNLDYIRADGRYLPLRDSCSDLTTEFGCLPSVLIFSNDGYKMLEELSRITKQEGRGIVSTSGKMGLIPTKQKYRRKLKELANRAVEVGGEYDEHGWHLIVPFTPEFKKVLNKIRSMMELPTEDILYMSGLEVYEKNLYGYDGEIELYHFFWKKIDKKIESGKEIIRTDAPAALIDRLKKINEN